MKNFVNLFRASCLLTVAYMVFISCQNKNGQVNEKELLAVRDSVTQVANNIAKAVSAKGPIAWLDYFENAPGFFMASDGALVFGSYAEGRSKIIKSINRAFASISLKWESYKIDPFTKDYAAFGAAFKEDIVLVNKQQMAISGYVTATVHFDGTRWRIRNMNWAIRQPPQVSK